MLRLILTLVFWMACSIASTTGSSKLLFPHLTGSRLSVGTVFNQSWTSDKDLDKQIGNFTTLLDWIHIITSPMRRRRRRQCFRWNVNWRLSFKSIDNIISVLPKAKATWTANKMSSYHKVKGSKKLTHFRLQPNRLRSIDHLRTS